MDNAKRRQEEEEARRRAQDLPDWFEMYNRLEQGAVEKMRRLTPHQPKLRRSMRRLGSLAARIWFCVSSIG